MYSMKNWIGRMHEIYLIQCYHHYNQYTSTIFPSIQLVLIVIFPFLTLVGYPSLPFHRRLTHSLGILGIPTKTLQLHQRPQKEDQQGVVWRRHRSLFHPMWKDRRDYGRLSHLWRDRRKVWWIWPSCKYHKHSSPIYASPSAELDVVIIHTYTHARV